MFKTRELLNAIAASGDQKMWKALWRTQLLDPDQNFFDQFVQPPQILYKYMPVDRLDHALPDEKLCSLRATPPNQLNDISEINFITTFVEDETNYARINQDYARTLTELFSKSPVSIDDVERYRNKFPERYGVELARDQLSKKYGVTSFSSSRNDVKMWTHYADNCKGIVVGYNVDVWVNHLVGTSILREVNYANRLPLVAGPRVVNQQNAYALMSSKGLSWEYEREWRLITELSSAYEIEKDIAVISIPQESVSSVLITDRTPQSTVDTIVQRLNNPSNNYRLWWIDRLQRVRDPTTLAFVGQIKTRAQPTEKIA